MLHEHTARVIDQFPLSFCTQMRNTIAMTMRRIVHAALPDIDRAEHLLTSKAMPRNFECAEPVIDAFSKACYKIPQVTVVMAI